MSASKALCLTTIAVMTIVFMLTGFGTAAAEEQSGCVECHTNAEILKKHTKSSLTRPQPQTPTRGGAVPPMPRYKKVLIDPAFFEDENHGSLSCQDCHHGDPEHRTIETAHIGVVLEPSYPAPGACEDCHSESETYPNSLHYSGRGMSVPIWKRASEDPETRASLNDAMTGHCGRCHATCGQCHVSRPVHVGGGFMAGHQFQASPPMELTCAACHSYGVAEFKGEFEGVEPDVHQEMDMTCLDCHPTESLHGGETKAQDMRNTGYGPVCLDCHDGIYEDNAENKKVHSMHQGKLSCQVCHSQAYTNCANCHLSAEWNGTKYDVWQSFKIGLNPEPTESRPDKFVTVRHVPVTKDMFDKHIPGALSNFDAEPTWKMSAPHNIRRKTKQNAECNNCHGIKNRKLFLMLSDVEEGLRGANRPAIVAPGMVPAAVTE